MWVCFKYIDISDLFSFFGLIHHVSFVWVCVFVCSIRILICLSKCIPLRVLNMSECLVWLGLTLPLPGRSFEMGSAALDVCVCVCVWRRQRCWLVSIHYLYIFIFIYMDFNLFYIYVVWFTEYGRYYFVFCLFMLLYLVLNGEQMMKRAFVLLGMVFGGGICMCLCVCVE